MKSKKIIQKTIYFLLGLVIVLLAIPNVRAQAPNCDPPSGSDNLLSLSNKIAVCQDAWNSMEKALKPHIDTLRKMESDIAAFQARINAIEIDEAKKAKAIAEGETQLSGFIALAGRRIRQFYIRSYLMNSFTTFFSNTNIGSLLRSMVYSQTITNQDKQSITTTALSVRDLQDRKVQLESERQMLSALKIETDKRAESVRKLVGDAEAYQSKLTGIISSLSAAQQNIINAKSGTFTTSVGDVPLADDPNAAPNYNPGFSPAFAAFSFGAYTHKKGMSQYGAKGRAESGQKYNDILNAYYHTGPVAKDTGGNINVQGFSPMDFETTYLYGIAEMPASFPTDALKAQAIAARSYAFSYKQSGTAICTTQSCQVWSQSKSASPPQAWKDAVDQTRGQVVEGVTAFYSSTTGGYSLTSGWDTKCGSQSCWTGDAYEKIAGSPWFYKGWYTSNYYNDSAKCGKSSPWLTGEEFADILNAWQVRKNGGDTSRILPVTINSCSIGGQTGNPYSMSEMRDAANNSGGAFTSVSGISVTYNSGGYTDSIIVNTNKGSVTISGSEFKETFNLRAPGYISIRSSLFNIEKK